MISVMLFVANLLGISQDDINWANAMGERYGAEEKRDGSFGESGYRCHGRGPEVDIADKQGPC